jgi:hypothetical protein
MHGITVKQVFARWTYGALGVCLYWIVGCVQAVPFVTIAPTAVQVGSIAYQAVEKADIEAVVPQGISEEDLSGIRRIALFMGGESNVRPYGRIGDLASVVGDNLSVELTKRGFHVYDWGVIQHTGRTATTIHDMVEKGKVLGAQAIVTGSVAGGQTRLLGILGVGGFKTVVQYATLKVIDVRTADCLMIITINYTVGQNPKIAAEGMAMVLQAKLESPADDLKKRLREKIDEKDIIALQSHTSLQD